MTSASARPARRPALANPLVVAVVYDGLCTFEFGCAVEVFGLPRPEMGPGWYRFAVAAAEPDPLAAAGGLRVIAEGDLSLLAAAGTIVIPGWRGADAPVPQPLRDAVRAAHARGARILSLCSGVFVLAAAGLLDGRAATTHWRYAHALTERFPTITFTPDVLYVDEGQVLTAAGSAAALDLCLHLVRRDFGPDAANLVARRLVVPAHRDGRQAQLLERPVARERASGARLAAALDQVRTRLAEPWPVEKLARAVATSPRSLNRRFREATGMSPGDWLIAERLARAREMLETSRAGIDAIAAACGFGSAAAMRHHFRRRVGLSPGTVRKRAADRAQDGGPPRSRAAGAEAMRQGD